MDCNKEEAIRAKGIVEKKMQMKDFVGARKIALKAQNLYPDLENIAQMLLVCNVHCSSEQKLYATEMDWYGILQVEEKADEITIKKQFKKFALLLHPDKNKFPGAEAAFKLVGEAQRVLLDKEKRALHDMRRNVTISRPAAAPYCPPQQANGHFRNVVLNNSRPNPQGPNPLNRQSQQRPIYTATSDVRTTFWTVCPFCLVKYQYRKDVLNRSISCQSCLKLYVAHDMNAAPANAFSRPTVFQQNYNAQKAETQSQPNFGFGTFKTEPVQNPGSKVGSTSDVRRGKVNQERGRKRARDRSKFTDSENEIDSDDSSDSDEDVMTDENGDLPGGQNSGIFADLSRRRSSRHKQQVSYKENLSDDGEDNSSKKAKGKRSFTVGENGDTLKEESSKSKQKACDEECLPNEAKSKRSSKAHDSAEIFEAPNQALFNYPDPEFSNFEKERNADCFAVGQLWAAYDLHNAMPRFYCRIKKISSPGFRVQITWLDADPNGAKEMNWKSKDLPFSCGKFTLGSSETTNDHLMFSHVISWVRGPQGSFLIYPRKGETWALFKDWDIHWTSVPSAKYDYEYVEIMSDYAEGIGIHVALLRKVEGFVSIFCRVEKEPFRVSATDMLRFSHRIPSSKMAGNEAEGVPVGSFELDPAALPITTSRSDHKVKPKKESEDDSKRSNPERQHDTSSVPSPLSPGVIEFPDAEFYNFDADKSQEKFQIGQIWALYSDEDGLPKYYGQIKKIVHLPAFTLHLQWLSSSSLPTKAIKWSDKHMPISCGRFKNPRNLEQDYDSTATFSHRVRALHVGGRRFEYDILPQKGQVWALYNNWNPGFRCSDLDKCEYEVVEVLMATESVIEVLFLDRVDGFNSVFKSKMHDGSPLTMGINQVELLRFSHQIPAFRLTEERGGTLRGFWELDPASLPEHYFRST
ncbi:hypothetical protein UlMin_009491 [Ulmus minor]